VEPGDESSAFKKLIIYHKEGKSLKDHQKSEVTSRLASLS
jgi:hypothetical protein